MSSSIFNKAMIHFYSWVYIHVSAGTVNARIGSWIACGSNWLRLSMRRYSGRRDTNWLGKGWSYSLTIPANVVKMWKWYQLKCLLKMWWKASNTGPKRHQPRHLGVILDTKRHWFKTRNFFNAWLNSLILQYHMAWHCYSAMESGHQCPYRKRYRSSTYQSATDNLFEADFNYFLKIQWGHRLVRRAWELDIPHPGQHGSVPQRTALDPIMLTQLTSDLCRVLKHDYARFDNDASACYDRIIVASGMLSARRCGMPSNAIQVHAEALKFMQPIHG